MVEKTTGELLDMLLARLHCDESNPLAAVYRQWIELVGSDMAAHARIVDVQNRVLVVEVDHPAWGAKLVMNRKRVLARMQTKFPELGISSLQVRASHDERRT